MRAGENFWVEAKLARERIALGTSACGLKLQEKSQFHSQSRLAKFTAKASLSPLQDELGFILSGDYRFSTGVCQKPKPGVQTAIRNGEFLGDEFLAVETINLSLRQQSQP